MKFKAQWMDFFSIAMGCILTILASTAGVAAVKGGSPALTSASGDGLAHLPSPATKVGMGTVRSGQSQAKARINGRCLECGLIVAMNEIAGYADAGDGMTDWVKKKNVDAVGLKSRTRYEMVVRMSNGSVRIINYEHPANWRVGERLIVIAGTIPPSR